VFVARAVPPVPAAYQSAVSPVWTVTLIVGIVPPVQYDLLPPLTGAGIIGHVQLGDVTSKLFMQLLPSVTVTVIFVPVGTADILHTFPAVFTTVPDVLVTFPAFTVTPNEYVSKFGAHVGPELSDIVGSALTTTVIVVVVAHSPAVGVNV
jgi:hypothetical protein